MTLTTITKTPAILDRSKPCPSGEVYSRLNTTPTPSTIRLAASRTNVDVATADLVIDAYHTGKVFSGVVAGKLVSGKDTLCVKSAQYMYRTYTPDATAPVLHTVSDFIREELDQVLFVLKNSATEKIALRDIVGGLGFDVTPAQHFIDNLFAKVRQQEIKASDRTDLNRMMLIYLADQGRRSQDPDYWVKICFSRILKALSEGTSAYLAGCRYPNEISPAIALGVFTTRLEISEEVQTQRLFARDGVAPLEEVTKGINECALDEFTGVNLIVGNDGEMQPTLDVITSDMAQHFQRLETI